MTEKTFSLLFFDNREGKAYFYLMIPLNSLSKSSRFYLVTSFESGLPHAREMHFDRFNLKKGTCRVSDYGYMIPGLTFECTLEAISKKAFPTREEAMKKISSLMKGKE